MHLKHSSLHLSLVNHGPLLSYPEFSILSRLGLTNAIIFLLIINSSLYSEAEDPDDDRNGLTRRKWCPWSPWSPCSTTKCFSGYLRRNPSIIWPSLEEISNGDDIQITQCVLPAINASRKPNRAYIQKTIHGQRKVIIAEKQRFRTCDCPSFSILNVFRLVSRHECYPGETVFECMECESSEKIYISRRSNSTIDLIPFCSFDHSGFQLYKILGGIIGAIALVSLLICFVRFLFKQICGPRQIDGSTTAGNGGLNRNSRRRNRTPHLQSNGVNDDAASEYLQNHRNTSAYPINLGNMDLPPAYTDVVKLSGITTLPNNTTTLNTADQFTSYDWFPPQQNNNLQIINPNGLPKSSPTRIPHRFSCSIIDDNEPSNNIIITSSQILTPKPPPASNTPPPPSYEEIVAVTTNTDRSVSLNVNDVNTSHEIIHQSSDNASTITTATTNTNTNITTTNTTSTGSTSSSGNLMSTDRTESGSVA